MYLNGTSIIEVAQLKMKVISIESKTSASLSRCTCLLYLQLFSLIN